MNLKSKRYLTLQNLYELKRVSSIQERMSSGRVFYKDHLLGLTDQTGILWPIEKHDYLQSKILNSGDWISFKCAINKIEVPTISNEEHYVFQINEIVDMVENKNDWINTKIESPLPNNEELQKLNLPNQQITSYFWSNKTNKRFQLLNKRNRALERTSSFFKNKGFFNIETPTLVPSGGVEVYLNSFNTSYIDHRNKQWALQLPTSPEFALKKVMTEGVEKIFQLSRAYRNNGEVAKFHEPEFIMLEWYRANATLIEIMDDTQNLVRVIAELLGSTKDLPKQWPVFRVDDLFKKHLNLNLEQLQNRDQFYEKAKHLSHSITPQDDWDTIFYKLFMEKIEPFLSEQKACFVTNYPIQMSALAKQELIKTSNGEIQKKPFAERMEAYLFGIEICNGYFELNDSTIFQERFATTQKLRPDVLMDYGFQNAMLFGLPNCAGNALGIDRVIALLLDLDNISAMYPIPFLSQFPADTVAWE
ncbi:amino acid--tRNA ligase-related protein [Pigmentibacter ruber]|uniref:amino acid--tRNA ligase-related protein n=1 Tax=Pigmentibacter ruber TaxID=2683196 RepID=UPI00131D011C|nr:amino acid--tRNA ligase-related protein [Pigmentibacter ruber]